MLEFFVNFGVIFYLFFFFSIIFVGTIK